MLGGALEKAGPNTPKASVKFGVNTICRSPATYMPGYYHCSHQYLDKFLGWCDIQVFRGMNLDQEVSLSQLDPNISMIC